MKRSICTLLFAVVGFALFAQSTTPTRADTVILEDGDIELLLKSFEPMVLDIKALGEKYQDVETMDDLDTLAAQAEVKAIFAKYGWEDDQFKSKVATMVLGMGLIAWEKELENLPEETRELAKALGGFVRYAV